MNSDIVVGEFKLKNNNYVLKTSSILCQIIYYGKSRFLSCLFFFFFFILTFFSYSYAERKQNKIKKKIIHKMKNQEKTAKTCK